MQMLGDEEPTHLLDGIEDLLSEKFYQPSMDPGIAGEIFEMHTSTTEVLSIPEEFAQMDSQYLSVSLKGQLLGTAVLQDEHGHQFTWTLCRKCSFRDAGACCESVYCYRKFSSRYSTW